MNHPLYIVCTAEDDVGNITYALTEVAEDRRHLVDTALAMLNDAAMASGATGLSYSVTHDFEAYAGRVDQRT